MTQNKSEIPALIVALGVALALVGGTGWWLLNHRPDSSSAEVIESETSTPQLTSRPAPEPTAEPVEQVGTFAEVTNIPSGEFTYGGSTSWAPIRGLVDREIKKALFDFTLRYTDEPEKAPGSGLGIQMLIDRKLDFAQSSRPLSETEKQQAQAQGITLKEVPVVNEGIAIAIPPSLAIPGLTLTQLKDIYTGKVTNWNEVGGPNLAIKALSRGDDAGTVASFKATVLNDQPFAPTVERLPITTNALRVVSDTPGSIYFASTPEIVGQCTVVPLPIGTTPNALIAPYKLPYVESTNCSDQNRNVVDLSVIKNQSYPLTRKLYVVFRENDERSAQAGEAYVRLLETEEGDRLLQQADFVPL